MSNLTPSALIFAGAVGLGLIGIWPLAAIATVTALCCLVAALLDND